jgi:CheY-like chemotaxis protein
VKAKAYAILADVVALTNAAAGFFWDLKTIVLVIPAIFACWASWAAIRASRKKEHQIDVETILVAQKVCEECKADTPPSRCPLGLQPSTCSIRHENRKLRVLYVEDNADDRLLLRHRVGAGFEVHEASTLQEGFRMLGHERFDVVLLDLGLPDSAGTETMERFRQRHPYAPALVLTGNSDPALQRRALELGYDGTIVKTAAIAADALVALVRAAALRRKPL